LSAFFKRRALSGAKSGEGGEETRSPLKRSLQKTLASLREKQKNAADLIIRELTISGVPAAFVINEGMVSSQTFADMLLRPLLNESFPPGAGAGDIADFIENRSLLATEIKDVLTEEELFRQVMSGFVVILLDGLDKGFAFGLQGYKYRSVSEPESEVNERGSKEGFTEPLNVNISLVRRRLKSPDLKFEMLTVGKTSKTGVCLVYMDKRADPELLRQVRRRIEKIRLDVILTSGYIQPFLEGKPWSLFSNVGTTERPDTLAAKVMEGRVGILVDGTPFALVTPYLFSENFQSLDDYAHRAFYASFIRLLKYASFLAAMLLPALYVAVGTFHPELLPQALLFKIAAAEESTPFPLMVEALLIHLLYEIMREAGLRLPKAVGHAIGIVGGLVIGDAAVSAGLIGTPTVLVVAMTAIASFVVPSLYEPVSLLRLIFIVIGGLFGLYGLAVGGMLLLVNISALQGYGVPYMAPISPFSLSAMRDTFIRASFPKMQESVTLQDLHGVDERKS